MNDLTADNRKIFVLDDDPTGTQTVSGVEIILQPAFQKYHEFCSSTASVVYVLTNTRALPKEDAIQLLTQIRAEATRAAREAGKEAVFLLRGDSTLRGHVFAEIDTFSQADSVSLFVPAFPEGGRVTVDGIHYLTVEVKRIPVHQTEFAKDTTFGYQSEKLVDYVAEAGDGRKAVIVPLEQLRSTMGQGLRDALLQAAPGTCVIPEAEFLSDLELIAAGLMGALGKGRHVVVRSASSFIAVLTNLRSQTIERVENLDRVLVVCGSHTEASTRQLQELIRYTRPPIVIPTDRILQGGLDLLIEEVSSRLIENLRHYGFAVLTSERIRRLEHGDLATGARVMNVIIEIVRKVSAHCDGVISKGGITSAQVAADGLLSQTAYVKGQLEAGVSLWEVELEDGRRLPYAVIPGNVGNHQTIKNIAGKFGVKLAYE
ncbi:four-carbon acid sugar kinase family protein [Paenibacillus sp. NRS-1760]|uniref:four-carbon acid sugar kinase family protein n=1 Tax=Paenibacillus sp. NRS-1760 TaxID=3233902 RepID=UPI003D2A3930